GRPMQPDALAATAAGRAVAAATSRRGRCSAKATAVQMAPTLTTKYPATASVAAAQPQGDRACGCPSATNTTPATAAAADDWATLKAALPESRSMRQAQDWPTATASTSWAGGRRNSPTTRTASPGVTVKAFLRSSRWTDSSPARAKATVQAATTPGDPEGWAVGTPRTSPAARATRQRTRARMLLFTGASLTLGS